MQNNHSQESPRNVVPIREVVTHSALFAIEDEEEVVGGVLFDPLAIARVSGILRPEYFYVSAHGRIYGAALHLQASGLPVDAMSVIAWLSDRKQLDSVGGKNAVIGLACRVVGTATIDFAARRIAEKYKRRELSKIAAKLGEACADGAIAMAEIVEDASRSLFELSDFSEGANLEPIADTVLREFTGLEDRQSTGFVPGLSCGFYDLDAMTQGFQRSDLIIVAGRPSMGKTSFTMNVARNIATFHKLPIAVFSLEMSKEQMTQRMMASESRIESGRMRSGRIQQREWESLGHAVGSLSQVPMFVDDSPNPNVAEIRSKSRRLMAEQGGALGLILIDYLQLMDGGSDNRVHELSKITRGLKALARELNVPVIALSQLSRSVESRTNKRPMMSDLRESGSIEQDADLIMMLYRDEYYNPDTPDRGIAEVIITKHRNGPIGTIKLLFEPQFTQFKNLGYRS